MCLNELKGYFFWGKKKHRKCVGHLETAVRRGLGSAGDWTLGSHMQSMNVNFFDDLSNFAYFNLGNCLFLGMVNLTFIFKFIFVNQADLWSLPLKQFVIKFDLFHYQMFLYCKASGSKILNLLRRESSNLIWRKKELKLEYWASQIVLPAGALLFMLCVWFPALHGPLYAEVARTLGDWLRFNYSLLLHTTGRYPPPFPVHHLV